MAIDGLFIHYLLEEINESLQLKNHYVRVNQIITVNDHEYEFKLANKKNLFFSLNPSSNHFRMTSKSFLSSPTPLTSFFKKHFSNCYISNMYQHENDRIVILEFNCFDELGYQKKYNMIWELTGKSANLIICDEDFYILEALKKSFLTDKRIIQPKVKYTPLLSEQINPFKTDARKVNVEEIEGISKQTKEEIKQVGLDSLLNYKICPTLVEGEKIYFYCFDFQIFSGKKTYFNTISELLEHYYTDKVLETTKSNEQKIAYNFISKELNKLHNKLEKQHQELNLAYQNQNMEQIADCLAANIHLVKKYQKEITVTNFYTNELITIPLNDSLLPNENINYYYNKAKKNKRTIISLQVTIKNTEQEIKYYEDLLSQLSFVNANDLKEMMHEIGIKKNFKVSNKPHILKYIDSDHNEYYVGKNNLQNDYLTHHFANKTDYFFHVKGIPGSHVILRGDLNSSTIIIASTLAAFYSKAANSYNVSVDYTLVKWVKKVKGTKGSFVTYTNEASCFANPSLEFINEHLSLDK